MKKRLIMAFSIFGLFFISLGIMCVLAENTAGEIRESVLRFHIVANSDSDADQADKFAVRDGIASLCKQLFENSDSKAQSMQIAIENKAVIEKKAMEILRSRDSDNCVNITLRSRFFPTRHYEGVSLPAGVYDTIDVQIGKAEGQNFWCVMFPGICLGSAAENNQKKMQDALSNDAADLVTKDSAHVKFKFRIVEIIENLKNLW